MKQVVLSVTTLNIPFDLFLNVTSIESILQIPRVDVAITRVGIRQMTEVKTEVQKRLRRIYNKGKHVSTH